ncbi:MAG TPA: hypothetical protein VMJ66_01050 [Geobacteraceae bacterium]|nr:hypothetical protein [Geobacteraceae bacterium]
MICKKLLTAVVFSFACLSVYAPCAPAEEAKFELKSSATLREVLLERLGKRTTLRLQSGEELEGTVTMVGESLVHLTKLSGKDYYDAVISVDRISAVLFVARGR